MNDLPAKIQEGATPFLGSASLHGSMYQVPAVFEHMQRLAGMFQASSLVPEHLRKNKGDLVIALDIAMNMGESPIMVMQNIYFVHGRAGWASQYMISRFNRAGIARGPITWKKTGQDDTLELTALATLKSGEVIDATVGMAMAKAEGWTQNKKYQTMAEHMLKYRSATFLIRLYAPQVMMGFLTADELEDMAASGQLNQGWAQEPHIDGVAEPAVQAAPEKAAPAAPSSSLSTDPKASGQAEGPAREERGPDPSPPAPAAAGKPQGAARAPEATHVAKAPENAPTAAPKPRGRPPKAKEAAPGPAEPPQADPGDPGADPLDIPPAMDRRPQAEPPADDQPRLMPYNSISPISPMNWAGEFIKLHGRMADDAARAALLQMNAQVIRYVSGTPDARDKLAALAP